MVIDFCSNDPIIQDTCTAPTAMDASAATLNATLSRVTVQTTTDNWAVTAGATQIKLADDGTAGHGMAQNTTESFVLSGITNPSAVGTFYARMYTYTANTWTGYTNAGSIGTMWTTVVSPSAPRRRFRLPLASRSN